MKFLILQQVDAQKLKFSQVYYLFIIGPKLFLGVASGDEEQGECLPWVPSASVACGSSSTRYPRLLRGQPPASPLFYRAKISFNSFNSCAFVMVVGVK